MDPHLPAPSSSPGFLGHTEQSRRIGPFLLSRNRYAPDARLGSHVHQHPFISFVLAGEYTERCGRRESLCVRGTLGFHPTGEEHSDRFGRREAMVLGIEVGCGARRGPGMHARFLADGPETRLAWQIASEFQRHCAGSDLIIDSLATELLCGHGGRERTRGTPRWLATAVEVAHDGHAERLSLATVAARAGVHPVHLARQFRARLGCTYGEYVRRVRLARALERLRRGADSIAEVAAATGFADQSHLTRLMTRLLGVAPGTYRRQWREKSTPE